MTIIYILYGILAIGYALVFIFIIYTLYAFIKGAPFVPSARGTVKKIIHLAGLHENDVLIDLGSGDGRILRKAAPSVKKAIGIEINPLLYYWSRVILAKHRNIEVRRESLWATDISEADVITLFFIAGKMNQLKTKIKKQAKPGTRVVSYAFKFPDWQYVKNDGKVYLYIV